MKSFSPIASIGLCLIILLISADLVNGQSRVRILQADVLQGAGEDMRKLIGNVELRTDDFSIVCDSAYHFQRDERIEAFGNIEIKSGEDIIWADYVRHNLRTEQSEFQGRVILNNKSTTVFSTKAFFDHKTGIATFPEYLRMEDENGVLTSETGIYYNRADSAIFRIAVQIADSTQYTEADSLFTNREAGYYELHGNVFLKDSEQNVIIRGDYVEADAEGYRKVFGNSLMRRINSEKEDTTFVQARELHIQELDTTYLFDAFEDVRIWTNRYSSLSDTANYDDGREVFILTGDAPKTWFNDIQLSGPYIEITLEDDQIRSLLSHHRPFAVQKDSATGLLHQITGDTLFVDFKDGEINFLQMRNNPELYYHSKDNEGNPDGAIELKTNEYIIMFFKDGEMTDGKAKKQSDGVFHPEGEETRERRLTGFVWTPELQPKKPTDVLESRYGEIPEERPIVLPRRYREFLNQSE